MQINSGVCGGLFLVGRGFVLLVLAAGFVLLPARAGAQLKSNVASVNLNATLNTSITITATPGLVNFTLVRSGVATGTSPVTITTTWTLTTLLGSVAEYAYFSSSAAALTDGASDNIPSASVSGSVDRGAYTAFTGTSPFAAGSGITLFNQFVFLIFPANRSDTLNLQISTAGLNLPAGTYTGVLHIQAQAN